VNVSDMRSLEFTLKRLMIKLFRTYDSGVIIAVCRSLVYQLLVNLLINVKLDFYRNVGLICLRIYCAWFASRSNVVHCCWHVKW